LGVRRMGVRELDEVVEGIRRRLNKAPISS
jgi:hypothetical protein